jgi:hypothetical protein
MYILTAFKLNVIVKIYTYCLIWCSGRENDGKKAYGLVPAINY